MMNGRICLLAQESIVEKQNKTQLMVPALDVLETKGRTWEKGQVS